MSDLKPCPFCGKQPEIGHYETFDNDEWWIGCNCECGPCTRVSFTYEQAIEAWNSRAERTCKIESSYLNDFTSNYECWYEFEMQCGYKFTWDEMEPPTYCPNCGRKAVSE